MKKKQNILNSTNDVLSLNLFEMTENGWHIQIVVCCGTYGSLDSTCRRLEHQNKKWLCSSETGAI